MISSSKSEAVELAGGGGNWPAWARGVASALLGAHLAAVLAAELGVPPFSSVEAWAAEAVLPYTSLMNLDHAHRYYAPAPSPTPVAMARLRFADGRPDRVVRVPDPGARPRLRYQRQLAMAFHLFSDFAVPAEGLEATPGRHWARSFARHLCKASPGCAGVSLYVQEHRFPPRDRIREAAAHPEGPALNLDAEEFFSTPERVGEFSCDAF